MPRTIESLVRSGILLVIIAGLTLTGYVFVRDRPQDVPWTELDLSQPIGAFTGRKLAALNGDFPQCRALLDRAGVDYSVRPPRGEGQCVEENGLIPKPGGATAIRYNPASVAPSCPVVTGLALWEWQVVQPAARQYLGSGVKSIGHFGAYSCRRMYGASEGQWSEHATGNAIDIAGFTLEDGRTVSVLADWNEGSADEQAFLRAVRDGACDLFATVLSPDYNAAHANHFHLDQADRGEMGWRACR